MTISPNDDQPRASRLSFRDERLVVDLVDGRTLVIPLEWYPRLHQATDEQRNNWQLEDEGRGIHWPDVDEDLSVRGMLLGYRAPGAPKPVV